MRKLAIFVEGQTEQLFIKRLIEEVAGKKNLPFNLIGCKVVRNRRELQLMKLL